LRIQISLHLQILAAEKAGVAVLLDAEDVAIAVVCEFGLDNFRRIKVGGRVRGGRGGLTMYAALASESSINLASPIQDNKSIITQIQMYYRALSKQLPSPEGRRKWNAQFK
jgi:hypothetical protein